MIQNKSWQGKVAIVTGGSSGIGKATALALVEHGAEVLITGRDEEKLNAVASENTNIKPLIADSAEPNSAERIVEAAFKLQGRIDLLVNNSGAGQLMPMAAYHPGEIANIAAVNIIAPSMLVKAGSIYLRESKGAIVNIGTAVSRNNPPMLAHYGSTKTALEYLTRTWALELADAGVRVNAIAPGPVKTGALTGMMGLSEEMAQNVERQEADQVPLGRRGLTTDIVPWVLMLGNSDNEWLTGQTLTIDGGWSLRS